MILTVVYRKKFAFVRIYRRRIAKVSVPEPPTNVNHPFGIPAITLVLGKNGTNAEIRLTPPVGQKQPPVAKSQKVRGVSSDR